MGMWDNGYRQGSGIIVTVEGIYNEGIFVQNKLTVCCLYFHVNSFFENKLVMI